MRAALLRLMSAASALIIRAQAGMTNDREWVLPGGLPSAGQELRVQSVNSGVITWEYFTSSGGSSGTVTSVAISAPTNEFDISGSPVSSSGTLGFSWKSQAINQILASPASGGAGAPTFRALVANDIPNLDAAKITTGTIGTARLPVGTAAGTVAAGNDSRFHNQNTDTGTSATSFLIDSGAGTTAIRIKNETGILGIRNSADTSYADLIVRNLTVQGTQTIINSNEVNIGDNIITLNSDYVGTTPTENGGIRINRGTAPGGAFQIIYNESTKRAQAGFEGAEVDLARIREFPFTSANVTAGIVTITHNFGRKPVVWNVYTASDFNFFPDVRTVNDTTIELNLGNVTVSGTWTLVAVG